MTDVRNIVLVHGGFVDGSGWRGVYDLLTADGFNVSVVQNQTLSLESDVQTTHRVLDQQDGPAILVGHSYGGVVISEAGRHERVAGVVYIAAFAPDAGESVNALIADPPPGAPVPPILPPIDGFLFLDRDKFAHSFAADLTAEDAVFMADSQVPWGVEALNGTVTEPAWKSKPSWYMVATDDRMIPPPAQRAMSERTGATVVEEAGSHSIYVSQPQATAELAGGVPRRGARAARARRQGVGPGDAGLPGGDGPRRGPAARTRRTRRGSTSGRHGLAGVQPVAAERDLRRRRRHDPARGRHPCGGARRPGLPWYPVATWALGWAHYCVDELELAAQRFKETVALGPPVEQWLVASASIAQLSMIAGMRGRIGEQVRLADEAYEMAREHGLLDAIEGGEVPTARGLALAARGEFEAALPELEKGLMLRRIWGQPFDPADGLIALATVTAASGDRARANALFDEAEAILAGCPDPGALPRRLAAARRAARGGASPGELSERELTVLRMLRGGSSEREIGQELFLSFNTVHTHVKSIYRKLGVSSRADAIAKALEQQLL